LSLQSIPSLAGLWVCQNKRKKDGAGTPSNAFFEENFGKKLPKKQGF
jgi:hypothetical protein